MIRKKVFSGIKIFLSLILLLKNITSYSQFQMGGHVGIFKPMGELGKYSSAGAGGGITLRYIFSEGSMGIGINGEYFSFSPKNVFGKNRGGIYYSCIPVTFQYTYFFPLQKEILKPFLAFNLGLYNENMSAESPNFGPNSFYDLKKLSFGIAPEGGLSIRVFDNIDVNIGAKINLVAAGVVAKNFGTYSGTNLKGPTSFFSLYSGISYTFP